MSKKRALKHPSEIRPVFWTFSGPTTVNMGLTLLDIFFYLLRHDWPIKVTKRRVEYAFSNFQICPNFVGPDIACIEFQRFFYDPSKKYRSIVIESCRKKKNLSEGIFVRPLRKKALLRFFEVRGAPTPPLRGSNFFLWYIPNLGAWAIVSSNKKKFHQKFLVRPDMIFPKKAC